MRERKEFNFLTALEDKPRETIRGKEKKI